MPMFVAQDPQGGQQSVEAQVLAKLRQDPPAAVQTLTQAELDAMKGPEYKAFHEAIEHARKQNGAEAPGSSTGHNPFSLDRQTQAMEADLNKVAPGADPYHPELPPAVKKLLDSQRAERNETNARDLWIENERARTMEGSLPVSRSEVRSRLAALPPRDAVEVAKAYVEQVVWNGNQLQGVSQADANLFMQTREMARASGAALQLLTPPERATYERAKDQYELLCVAYVQGDLASFSRTLTGAALKGTDPHKAAESIYDTLHNPALTDTQKRQKFAEAINTTSDQGLTAIVQEYNALAERKASIAFYQKATAYIDALAKDKNETEQDKARAEFTRFAASLTPEQASKLEFMADQYAHANKLPTIREKAIGLEKLETASQALAGVVGAAVTGSSDRGDLQIERTHLLNMLTGFSAERAAAQLNGAMTGIGTTEKTLYSALAWVPGKEDAKDGMSAYTPQQLDQIKLAYLERYGKVERGILEQIGAAVAGTTVGPSRDEVTDSIVALRRTFDETLSQAITKEAAATIFGVSLFKDKAQLLSALSHGNTEPSYKPTNFVEDIRAAKIDLTRTVAASIYYGSDVTTLSHQLHTILENGRVNSAQAESVVRLLEHGPDATRQTYLSDEERIVLFQSHDELFPGMPLRVALDKKLEGDARTRALQIYDDGFYASEQADLVFKDVKHLAVVAKGFDSNQDLRDRLEQTDKQLRLRHGITLEEHVMKSALTPAEKEELLLFVHLPEAIDLNAELNKIKPDAKKVDELVIAHPILAKAYDALFSPPLVKTLENAALSGKMTWTDVALQEVKLTGIQTSTVQNMVALMTDHNFSLEDAAKAATKSETEQKNLIRLARLPQTARAYEILNASVIDADQLNRMIEVPEQAAEYRRVFGRDLKNEIYEAGLARINPETQKAACTLDPLVAAQQLLKLEGLPAASVETLRTALDPKAPTIGTENSPLRGRSKEQIAFTEEMYNYVEDANATLRGEGSAVTFNSQVQHLFVQNKISYNELVRTSALLSGIDPWNKAEAIRNEPLEAKALLEGVDPRYSLQIALIHREKHPGEGLMATIASKQGELVKKFPNADEFANWFNDTTALVYGANATRNFLAVDDALTLMKDDASTREQQALAAEGLKSVLEQAMREDSHLQTIALYDDMLGTPGKAQSEFYLRVDDAANNWRLSAENHKRIVDLATGNAVLDAAPPAAPVQPEPQTNSTGR